MKNQTVDNVKDSILATMSTWCRWLCGQSLMSFLFPFILLTALFFSRHMQCSLTSRHLVRIFVQKQNKQVKTNKQTKTKHNQFSRSESRKAVSRCLVWKRSGIDPHFTQKNIRPISKSLNALPHWLDTLTTLIIWNKYSTPTKKRHWGVVGVGRSVCSSGYSPSDTHPQDTPDGSGKGEGALFHPEFLVSWHAVSEKKEEDVVLLFLCFKSDWAKCYFWFLS